MMLLILQEKIPLNAVWLPWSTSIDVFLIGYGTCLSVGREVYIN
jgi:hypothetical protein